ncbi:WD40-repeat-containing domain protein [Lipomyces orientalis]|uniref:WD40-repeat-containing domain protein n=1 Tax=Lipomyces orientalis TaxID=1233043 RepID=A0ACC3TKF4_9ASCO
MLSSYLFTRESGLTNPRELRSAQLLRQYSTLVRSDKRYFPTRHSGIVNALAVDRVDNRYMISGGSDSRISIWDLNSREGQRHRYEMVAGIPAKKGHKYGISGISWWPFDNGMFITGSFDETLKVWDTEAMEEVYKFELGARLNAHDISPVAEHCLVACAADYTALRLIDLRSSGAAQMLSSHEGTTVNSVRWSPADSFMLASGGSDGTVRLWDIRRSDACLTVLNLENIVGKGVMSSVNFNQRTESFSSSTTAAFSQVKSHRGVVNGLVWLDNGKKLVSTGTDEMIRVWDLTAPFTRDTNTLVNFGPLVRNRYLQCINMLLSPLGDCFPQLLFFPSDTGDILVFQVSTGRLVRRLAGSLNTRKRTCGLACRGSEYVELFSGNSDGDIILWEAEQSVPMPDKKESAEHGPKTNVLTEICKGLEMEIN